MTETFKGYITRYAMSKGVFMEGLEGGSVDDVVRSADPQKRWQYYHGEGLDWHRTKKSAVQRAEQMRKAKISSLEKQIAKLKAMDFNVIKGDEK